jgi:flagellar motor switch/type III secretory pathway protein FliN
MWTGHAVDQEMGHCPPALPTRTRHSVQAIEEDSAVEEIEVDVAVVAAIMIVDEAEEEDTTMTGTDSTNEVGLMTGEVEVEVEVGVVAVTIEMIETELTDTHQTRTGFRLATTTVRI